MSLLLHTKTRLGAKMGMADPTGRSSSDTVGGGYGPRLHDSAHLSTAHLQAASNELLAVWRKMVENRTKRIVGARVSHQEICRL